MADEGRILVEGGPVHRRISRTLALIAGFLLGVTVGLIITFVRLEGVANRNCDAITTIAHIQHRQVEGQAALTKALLDKGFTFGIPKEQLPLLIAQSEAIQRQFLAELDALAKGSC